jgi:transposase
MPSNNLNSEGKIVKELDFSNNSQGIAILTLLLSMDDRVVMLSTGPYWLDLCNQLDE